LAPPNSLPLPTYYTRVILFFFQAYIPHMREKNVIFVLCFSFWVISISMNIFSFIRFPANCIITFILVVEKYFIYHILFMVLGFKLRALCFLGLHSTLGPCLQPPLFLYQFIR
jgi:hypothetical protein